MTSKFRAGAAEVGFQDVIIAHWAKKGVHWETRPYDPRLRCLVLESDGAFTIIFSADWGFRWDLHLDTDFKALVANRLVGHGVQVFCFATCANHDVDCGGIEWGALKAKDKRYEATFHQGLLHLAEQVLNEALADRREAGLTFGQGQCESITRDGFWPQSDHDTQVDVLRLDDTAGCLIATIVNFAARADDMVKRVLSGGFARVMEQTVQSLYGKAPVFFFGGGYGRYIIMRRNPIDYEEDKEAHLRTRAELLDKDYLRVGRILGAEVCKVLAEIETARDVLQVDNERTRQVVFAQPSAGLAIDEPRPQIAMVPATLWPASPPSVDECVKNLEECEAQLKPLRKRLGGAKTNNTYYLLQPGDEDSDVFRFMELRARRSYWALLAGHAKLKALGRFPRPMHMEPGLLVFSPELAVVMVPGGLCCSTAREIREKSPFPHTLVWIDMAHSWGILLPEAETQVCGQHAGYGVTQESLDEMVRSVVDGLKAIREGMSA